MPVAWSRMTVGYVVLREADGNVLSVYRIRPDNLTVRRTKRPPKRL